MAQQSNGELGQVIAEGKTKIIFEDPRTDRRVIIRSKDDITAGNGARHDVIKGKGAAATRTTCNVFEFLNREVGPNTHFIRRLGTATDFLAHRLTMIPLEVVVRNVAAGSYLKRHPEVAPNAVLAEPVTELYYKDDEGGDPMVVVDLFGGRVLFYHASKPLADGFLKEEPMEAVHGLSWFRMQWMNSRFDGLAAMVRMTRQVNRALTDLLARLGFTLVDLKVEFGVDPDGYVRVGDVIDNDSWRLRRGGPDGEELSKQRWYRDPPQITPEVLGACLRGYEEVADITSRLCER